MTLLCDIIYSDDKNTETNTNKNVKKEKKKIQNRLGYG